MLPSCPLFVLLNPRFGRKKVVFMSLAAQSVAVLLQSFSTSWRMFCIMFLFIGASQISLYISAFVLGTELAEFNRISLLLVSWLSAMFLSCHYTGTEVLSKTMRVIFATLGAFLFYCIGYMMLPWIAYGIREWRTLLAVLSMTSVVTIPLWWLVSLPTKLQHNCCGLCRCDL